jgi:O-antigen/teichoic acid export membrane protein
LWDSGSDFVSNGVLTHAVPFAVAAVASVGAAAGMRGAQALLGPVNVATMSLVPLLQMDVARHKGDLSRVRRSTRRATLVLSLGAALYCLPFALLPSSIGTELLGPTWSVASVMMWGFAIHSVARVPFLTISTTLRSLGSLRGLVILRTAGALLILVGASAGAMIDVWAIPVGMAVGAGLTAVVGVVILRGMVEENLVEGAT